MWILIMILLTSSGHTSATLVGSATDLNECFIKREALLIEANKYDGHFPTGMSAVCMRLPVKGVEL